MYYFAKYDSPLGEMVIVSDEKSLKELWFTGDKYTEKSLAAEAVEDSGVPIIKAASLWLDRYFAGEAPEASELSIAPEGSEFRQHVMNIMLKIPYGETTTYGRIASEAAALMGKERMSAQAVGGAVGHNPISIIIPCHRVIGKNGSLTGYAGGIDKKIKLLEIEHVDMKDMFVPKKGTAL